MGLVLFHGRVDYTQDSMVPGHPPLELTASHLYCAMLWQMVLEAYGIVSVS